MTGAQLYQRLLNNIATVGNRVFTSTAQQGAETPYAVLKLVSDVKDYTHNGASGLKTDRYQVSVFGESLTTARTAIEEATTTLEAYKTNGVSSIFRVNRIEVYEVDTNLYHVAADFIIRHKE